MRAITLSLLGLFVALALAGLILPAFFDVNFMGQFFDKRPAPWAISDEDRQKFKFTESQLRGRLHFQNYCANCHGPEGRGNGPQSISLRKRPPNFIASDTTYRNGLTPEGVLKTLNEGFTDSEMPTYNALPSDAKADLVDFVLYLRQHPELF